MISAEFHSCIPHLYIVGQYSSMNIRNIDCTREQVMHVLEITTVVRNCSTGWGIIPDPCPDAFGCRNHAQVLFGVPASGVEPKDGDQRHRALQLRLQNSAYAGS